jgi:tetratricopeptide (TPR) repeat protein
VLDGQNAVRIDAASVQSPTARRQAIATVEGTRAAYGLDQPGDWRRRPGYARLDDTQRQTLTLALAEHALLAAHAERLNAVGRPPAEAAADLERAVEWNRKAEALCGPDAVPAAVGEQRAALARRLGRPQADSPTPVGDTTLDLFLRGLGKIADADHRGAATVLEELVKVEPQHAAGQFALGFVYQTLGLYYPAIERYQVAKALAKHDPRPAYNRGALLLFHRKTDEAIADLTTAVERDPAMTEAYYQRATARLQKGTGLKGEDQKKVCTDGLADIDTAVRLGGERYRFVALRGLLRAKAGDAAGAEQDRLALDGMTPQDEQDYGVRGNQRIRENRPQDALADFRTATEVNPLSVSAWNNRAAQESALKLTAEAAVSLAELIRLVPEHTAAKFERAVMLARLGDRDGAVKQLTGLTPFDAHTWYQQAAVYALGSETHLDDAQAALTALKMAKKLGYDLKQLTTDDDFATLRDRVDVQPLIDGKAKE